MVSATCAPSLKHGTRIATWEMTAAEPVFPTGRAAFATNVVIESADHPEERHHDG